MVNVEPWPKTLVTLISPPDCLAKPNAWLRPKPVPLPTSLVVKKGSKIASSLSAAIPDPLSATVTAKRRNSIYRPDVDQQAALPLHRVPGIDREIDQGRFELRDVSGGKTWR